MKQFLLFLSILLSFNFFSQKQNQGNTTLELEFSPLGAEPIKINSIRARHFIKNNKALRMSIFLGGSSNPTNTDSGNITLTNNVSNADFILRPGFEHHFSGTEKLSPFIGGEAYFGFSSNSTSSESIFNTDEIMTTINRQRNSTYGLNILAGSDFYFSEKIYVGVELGYGFLYEGAGVTKTKYKNPSSSSLENSTTKGTTSSLNWGPNYQGTLRLGFCIK